MRVLGDEGVDFRHLDEVEVEAVLDLVYVSTFAEEIETVAQFGGKGRNK